MSNVAWPIRGFLFALCVGGLLWFASSLAAEPDPAVLSYKLPDQIEWSGEGGAKRTVLVGDPSKPGLYVTILKLQPGNWNPPHFHPHDRFITVISGTWWVGWGDRGDPESTFPLPAGSFVTHYANRIHYDGAKDEAVVLQIVGMGPATATPAAAPR